ncbi:atp-dependent clp protease atp-binding protein, partial [Lasius niger]
GKFQDVNRNLSVDMGDVPLPESSPDCSWESVTAKEVIQGEASAKKRKANASPVISVSSEENVVPSSLPRRGGLRKCRIVDSLVEDIIKESVDLTREPTYSDDYADSKLVTSAGSSKRKPTSKKKKVSKSRVDFKEELDDITYEQLLDMGATNTGAMGLEMLDLIDSVRAHSSGGLSGS